jgi:hypothetical protein
MSRPEHTKIRLGRNVVMHIIRLDGDARSLGRPDVTAEQILPALEALDCDFLDPGMEIEIGEPR